MGKETKVETFYDNVCTRYSDFEFRVCDAILEHFLRESLPKNKKLNILDVGCGIGRFSKPLLEQGHSVALTDISQGMLDKAKKLLKNFSNIKFYKESVTNLKHSDGEFDVVIMMNAILDYCGDHAEAVKEAFRVLKRGGLFIGNVNNRLIYCKNHELKEENYDLFEQNMKTGDRYIIWGDQEEGHMSHEFTLHELKETLLKGGFTIQKISGVFNLLDKYEMEKIKNKKAFIELQIKYAGYEEYINNSSDFFFVAEKPQ